MPTEHLHHTLSPQAHAALHDALARSARRERRLALQASGRGWSLRLQGALGRLVPRVFKPRHPFQPEKA